jgi:hypothetical protein
MDPEVRMKAECGISHKNAKHAIQNIINISHEVGGSFLN